MNTAKPMNILAIDTSTDHASIALLANQVLYSKTNHVQRLHAQHILPTIEQLLQQSGFSLKQLDGIAFGRGPGSFTGLRIACSVVKGLAYAHNLPVYPVSCLAAIAFETISTINLKNDSDVLVMVDARMNQIYWANYNEDFEAQEHVSNADAIELLVNKPLIVAGVGYKSYLSLLPKQLVQRIANELVVYPKAEIMIRMVQEGLISPRSAKQASPIYVRDQITQGEKRG